MPGTGERIAPAVVWFIAGWGPSPRDWGCRGGSECRGAVGQERLMGAAADLPQHIPVAAQKLGRSFLRLL